MITNVVFRSLRSRSRLIPVEELIGGCAGSRLPEIVPDLLTIEVITKSAEVCPTNAITAEGTMQSGIRLRLDYGKCIGCGRCTEIAGGAIRPAERLSQCGVSRQELVQLWQPGRVATEDHPVDPRPTRERIYGLLGRALNIRQLDPGSCNGCESEITALTNPYYDLERFGIHFVASPKHADMLLVTGPITRNMATAVRQTYQAVPAPKLVVAVGACGCSGGIFCANSLKENGGSLATGMVAPVDSLLPVDGYIPGCPPTPAMLISGILTVLERCRR
jgi:Ni,Fe-hydrogenase III small subunit/ferredoxin